MCKKNVSFLLIFWGCVFAIKAQSFCSTFPYAFDRFGKIIVRAEINGQTGNFLFDTGAPTCLTSQFAQKTGVKPQQSGLFEDSNGQTSESDVAIIPQLTLGSVHFTHVECAVWKAGNMIEQFGVDGVVGYTLFADKVVCINSRKKEISIASSLDVFPESIHSSTPIDMRRNNEMLPIFTIELDNGVEEEVMFDSGSYSALDLAENRAKDIVCAKGAHLLNTGYGATSVGAAGMAQNTLKHRLKIDTLKIGNGVFVDVPSITTAGSISRVGSQLMNYGFVSIDYPRQKFYFTPFATSRPPSLYVKEWDVVLTFNGANLLAGLVWGELKNHVCPGDIIVAVNGKPCNTPEEIRRARLEGDKAEITVKNAVNGEEKTVTIYNR